ncbi:MAG: hypothetical protein ACJAVN_001530 [Roseivirga sp.]|jgi:hypothetical protein
MEVAEKFFNNQIIQYVKRIKLNNTINCFYSYLSEYLILT